MSTAAVAVVPRVRRWANRGAMLAAGVAVLALAGLAAGMLLGYRALVVRSGSMEPAIDTGDIVLTKLVDPGEVSTGDVVTFRDPSRQEKLITHRVVGRSDKDGGVEFVTKGDANTGIERWRVDAEGTVGRVSARIPRAGYVVTSLGHPFVRIGLLAAGAALLVASLLRRIWAG